MLYRSALKYLVNWKNSSKRKPLIIRGARQVGKTQLVKNFSCEFRQYIEINFDETPEKGDFFRNNTVQETIKLIEVDCGFKIINGETLIFLDEIQAVPDVLPMLRYFYEKVPDLHVIAAGSLLEFLLADHEFSMPVGRIEYFFLGPLSFDEFLKNLNETLLLEYLHSFDFSKKIPESIHQKTISYLKTFFIIGGMPEAVDTWLKTDDFIQTQKIHASILQTYEDDFGKYRKNINPEILRTTLKRMPSLVGGKVRYTNIDRHIAPSALNTAIKALAQARIITQIFHSAGNGIPLGSQINYKKFKPLLVDIGIYSFSLSLRLTDIHPDENLIMINKGALSEQFVGQELIYDIPSFIKPELFYWHREKKGSAAEIDYLCQKGQAIIPVEVKAGKTGSLRSLHTFAASRKSKIGVRFNLDTPSIVNVSTTINNIGKADYKLISLPLYFAGQFKRILNALHD